MYCQCSDKRPVDSCAMGESFQVCSKSMGGCGREINSSGCSLLPGFIGTGSERLDLALGGGLGKGALSCVTGKSGADLLALDIARRCVENGITAQLVFADKEEADAGLSRMVFSMTGVELQRDKRGELEMPAGQRERQLVERAVGLMRRSLRSNYMGKGVGGSKLMAQIAAKACQARNPGFLAVLASGLPALDSRTPMDEMAAVMLRNDADHAGCHVMICKRSYFSESEGLNQGHHMYRFFHNVLEIVNHKETNEKGVAGELGLEIHSRGFKAKTSLNVEVGGSGRGQA